jgi:hypothetical protein
MIRLVAAVLTTAAVLTFVSGCKSDSEPSGPSVGAVGQAQQKGLTQSGSQPTPIPGSKPLEFGGRINNQKK